MCVIWENVDLLLICCCSLGSPLWPVHAVSAILGSYLLLWLRLLRALGDDVPAMFVELFPQFLADLADFSCFNEESNMNMMVFDGSLSNWPAEKSRK